MKARLQWEVDGALKTWEPPEILVTYAPVGISGRDKDGAPIIIVNFGSLDIVGLLHSVSKQDLIKMTIQTLENALELAAEAGGYQLVAIFDMDGFNLRQYAWRPGKKINYINGK